MIKWLSPFRALRPKTMRMRMMLLTMSIVSLSIMTLGFFVDRTGREALLEEKRAKLYGMTRLLDAALGEGFAATLQKNAASDQSREDKIATLEQALKNYTDTLTSAYPGSGAGYYSKELDAIVTYSPSGQFHDRVGLSIRPDHPGRRVMSQSQPIVESGPLVRGNIMNAMIPITRHNDVIGYIWANELTDDIERQMRMLDWGVLLIMGFGLLISWTLIALLSDRFAGQIEQIKKGVRRLRFDGLSAGAKLPSLPGEIGEISDAINNMATSLQDAKTFNEHILDSITDGIITIDNAGALSTLNAAAQRITGFSPEKFIGRPYRELFDEASDFHSRLLNTLHTGQAHLNFETDYPTSHDIVHIRASTSLLRDGNQNIIGAVLVFQDMTHEHDMHLQIERAERLAALGELMAGVAHEIRNPLTAIRGFGQYLQQTDDKEEWHEYLPIIIREVDSINRVIQQLLDYAKPHRTHYQSVQLDELIRETLLLVRTRGSHSRIDFHLNLDATLPNVRADAEQLKQVLLNILINAVQAIKDAGSIIITTRRHADNAVEIEIMDSGSGIAEENLAKIFDPFFTTKPTGTGLGLAMVQRIMSAHEGSHIQIANRTDQTGCIVTLTLPIAAFSGVAP